MYSARKKKTKKKKKMSKSTTTITVDKSARKNESASFGTVEIAASFTNKSTT